MNHSTNSHSRIFLMELIVAILFFSIASAICLKMFAASRQMGKDTAAQNMAMNQAGNVAELLKSNPSADGTLPNCLLEQYPYAVIDMPEATVCFDAGFQHCNPQDAVYSLRISKEETDGGLIPYQITVWDTADPAAAIYSLDLKLHPPILP